MECMLAEGLEQSNSELIKKQERKRQLPFIQVSFVLFYFFRGGLFWFCFLVFFLMTSEDLDGVVEQSTEVRDQSLRAEWVTYSLVALGNFLHLQTSGSSTVKLELSNSNILKTSHKNEEGGVE